MTFDESLALLRRTRAILGRHMFDESGEIVRDDIAEVCMAIDDALPDQSRVPIKQAAELPRSPEEAAA